MNQTILATIATLLLSMNIHVGASGHNEQHFQQKAHLHGLAELMLVLEGNKIEMNLDSPAANILGFEHRASTAEQQRSVHEAKATLESPKQLFSFTGTHCEITVLKIDVSAVLNTEGSDHEETEHEHHHDQTEHDSSEHETHSEISANYQFHCEQGSKLTAITLNFFEHFPGIETLKAAWVTETNQSSAELIAKSTTIYLK